MGFFIKQALVAALAGWVGIDVYMSVADALRGTSPVLLFQWDASNALGQTAFSGGAGAVLLGLFLDYIVSLGWAIVAVIALERIRLVRAHPLTFGVILGAIVMYVMLWVLVPLGHAGQVRMTLSNFIIVLIGHTFFFGVPLVLTASAYGRRRTGLYQVAG